MKTLFYFLGAVIVTIIVLLCVIPPINSPQIINARQCGEYTRIPKIVHQTVESRYVTGHLHALRLRHARMNPTYTFLLHDDEDQRRLMSEIGGDWLTAYNALSIGVARADVWRLAVLYKYGGVYLDWKSGIIKPLHEWVNPDDQFLLSYEGIRMSIETAQTYGLFKNNIRPPAHGVVNWALGFEPRHPLLRNILDNICANVLRLTPGAPPRTTLKEEVLHTTGPMAIASVLAESPNTPNFNSDFAGKIIYQHPASKPRELYRRLAKKHYSRVYQPLRIKYSDS